MAWKRGLTLGKFAPLHKGHQFVIETALAEMDEVIVLIYDCPETTTVPLTIRANWLRRLYPQVQIIEAWDGPTEVGDTPEIKRKHEDYILNELELTNITHFYSSEFYGEHMSVALGAVNRLVDCARQVVPVSGTLIRQNPFNNVQSNKRDSQEKPPSEKLFVILPGHPFYGQPVKVISRQSSTTYTRCTIENPADPNFHHQIPERWLSANPPSPEPAGVASLTAVCLSLTALDKMTQMILTQSQMRKDKTDADAIHRSDRSNLGADASPAQSSTGAPAFLPGSQSERRKR